MKEVKAKYRLYGVGDVSRISGLTRNQIFYWSQVLAEIKPEFKTSGRQYFDIHGVLDFRLIFELQCLGLSPKTIQYLVWSQKKPKIFSWFSERIIKKLFLKDQKKYEAEGLFLVIIITEYVPARSEGEYIWLVGTEEEAKDAVFGLTRKEIFPTNRMKGAMIVNLLKIIKDVEGKTGERLE